MGMMSTRPTYLTQTFIAQEQAGETTTPPSHPLPEEFSEVLTAFFVSDSSSITSNNFSAQHSIGVQIVGSSADAREAYFAGGLLSFSPTSPTSQERETSLVGILVIFLRLQMVDRYLGFILWSSSPGPYFFSVNLKEKMQDLLL